MGPLNELAFPISLVLIPLVAFIVFYAIFGLSDLYLLTRFGAPGPGMTIAITIFTLGTIVIFGGAALLLMQYDLSYVVSLSGLASALVAPAVGL